MIGSKHIEKIAIIFISIVVVFALFLTLFPKGCTSVARSSRDDYRIRIFGRDVIEINITADSEEWQTMLDNKMSKPYIECNLEVDGRPFDKVGIRPKGNSSLTSIHGEKLSFRFDFNHYIGGQSLYGLEQMVINNLQADATYMKDFVAYDLMEYMGVKAPLHTFAFVKLNGKPLGMYLAVEVYDTDYALRAFNDAKVNLYNVKNSGVEPFIKAEIDPVSGRVISIDGFSEQSNFGGPGGPPPGPPPGGPGGPPPPPSVADKNVTRDIDDFDKESFPDGFGRMPMPEVNMSVPQHGRNSGGGDLVFTDGNTESYSNIFGNAVASDTSAEEFGRVIRAIYFLNKEDVTNAELEKYWDVDGALRYLAVHAFMVNSDSYTGNMMQNFALAEQNGRITILPWDYNLSFGNFGGLGQGTAWREGNSTEQAVNHSIDEPVFVAMESRPLVNVLLSRTEYKQKYYGYLSELTSYVTGDFRIKLAMTEKAIYPYVCMEDSSVAFFTPDEHLKGYEVLLKFLDKRSESINKQIIDGENAEFVNVTDFTINEMGTMGGPGGPPGGMGGGPPHGMSPSIQQDGVNFPILPAGNGNGGEIHPSLQNQNENSDRESGFIGTPPSMYGQNANNTQMMPPQMFGENGAHMPPPPPPPPMSTNTIVDRSMDAASVTATLLCIVLLIAAIGVVKLFKRRY